MDDDMKRHFMSNEKLRSALSKRYANEMNSYREFSYMAIYMSRSDVCTMI